MELILGFEFIPSTSINPIAECVLTTSKQGRHNTHFVSGFLDQFYVYEGVLSPFTKGKVSACHTRGPYNAD